jgi:hypothetical protein
MTWQSCKCPIKKIYLVFVYLVFKVFNHQEPILSIQDGGIYIRKRVAYYTFCKSENNFI